MESKTNDDMDFLKKNQMLNVGPAEPEIQMRGRAQTDQGLDHFFNPKMRIERLFQYSFKVIK